MKVSTSLLAVASAIAAMAPAQAASFKSAPIFVRNGLTPPTVPLSTQLETAISQMDAGRYSEAADSCEDAVEAAPGSPLPYELRGTLALWLGAVKHAETDFATALALRHGDPAAVYGQALCAMSRGKDARKTLLSLESDSQLTPEQAGDVATAIAYLDFIHHDTAGCKAQMDRYPATDTARQELQAILQAHIAPDAGIAALSDFLTPGNGVPRVVEESGVRMRFDVTPASVEPSVLEPSLRSMYSARLEQNLRRDRIHTGRDLTAPSAVTPVDTAVPGRPAATVYASPSDRDAAASDDGIVVTSNTDAIPADDMNRIAGHAWNLVRLRPSRRVAEDVLARLEMRKGDRADAEAHSLVAIALDPMGETHHGVGQMILRAERSGSRKTPPPVAVHSGSPYHPWVTLTFDDGPNPQKTPALLDALADAHAPATFFVVGQRAEAAPDLVRRMAREGHDVENHSYTHPNIAECIPSTVESEILRNSIIVRNLTGRYPIFFRPPGGNASATLARLASAYGVTLAFWSIDAITAEYAGSPDALVAYIMRRVGPGSVILMHNGIDTTTAAVPKLVAALRAKGYKIVTLRQMMAAK